MNLVSDEMRNGRETLTFLLECYSIFESASLISIFSWVIVAFFRHITLVRERMRAIFLMNVSWAQFSHIMFENEASFIPISAVYVGALQFGGRLFYIVLPQGQKIRGPDLG